MHSTRSSGNSSQGTKLCPSVREYIIKSRFVWYVILYSRRLEENVLEQKPWRKLILTWNLSQLSFLCLQIVAYESETIIPDSLFLKPGTKLPDEKKVPVVQIKFEGWGPKYECRCLFSQRDQPYCFFIHVGSLFTLVARAAELITLVFGRYNEKVSENEVHTVKFPGAQHETLVSVAS